jgi:ABC-type amino acid transport system permease subunit
MPRKGRRQPRPREPLPPPLPPKTRIVGQLVAETVAFYRHHFFQVLPLGVSVAALTQLTVAFGRKPLRARGHPSGQNLHDPQSVLGGGIETTIVLGALLLTVSYIAAIVLVTGTRPDRGRILTAYAAGVLVFIPTPILAQLLILPAVAYLALVGWVVPAAIVEGLGFRDSFRRAVQLARVDYVHAAGGLATLVIVFYLTRLMLALLLRSGGESTERVAAALSDLVLSPMLFVGSALLYLDQSARLEAKSP